MFHTYIHMFAWQENITSWRVKCYQLLDFNQQIGKNIRKNDGELIAYLSHTY